ncbi:hypothetical protein [Streptomyces caniscabiei]|uniref:Uncharacterized protein n=1 Tax=Streptomyces caniscabiei TaxID=2746961 RepID=A0A927L7Q1_9ACTN|nr:hypothetical protein [Streptomyces caniscabiei]MBD9726573.1 hypothetical protein [Streptomyces caniscabiei]MDX3511568.1 hypothetical protein [Streptomyces caniscabiei]MDX3719117.1 hypothetical protein [Streptomyces caniscabiei]MDX3725924.1 hypothetical protein [Streptomyces caniscabiei]WEO29731.1 hypothetical protein IHE65_44895 [Streptomyces caniscabiei]
MQSPLSGARVLADVLRLSEEDDVAEVGRFAARSAASDLLGRQPKSPWHGLSAQLAAADHT